MGLILNGPFSEVVRVRLGYCRVDIVLVIIWDSNKAIDIGNWSICWGGHLERFYCTSRLRNHWEGLCFGIQIWFEISELRYAPGPHTSISIYIYMSTYVPVYILHIYIFIYPYEYLTLIVYSRKTQETDVGGTASFILGPWADKTALKVHILTTSDRSGAFEMPGSGQLCTKANTSQRSLTRTATPNRNNTAVMCNDASIIIFKKMAAYIYTFIIHYILHIHVHIFTCIFIYSYVYLFVYLAYLYKYLFINLFPV